MEQYVQQNFSSEGKRPSWKFIWDRVWGLWFACISTRISSRFFNQVEQHSSIGNERVFRGTSSSTSFYLIQLLSSLFLPCCTVHSTDVLPKTSARSTRIHSVSGGLAASNTLDLPETIGARIVREFNARVSTRNCWRVASRMKTRSRIS